MPALLVPINKDVDLFLLLAVIGAMVWASLGLLVPRALGVGYDVIDDALAGLPRRFAREEDRASAALAAPLRLANASAPPRRPARAARRPQSYGQR